jgi:ribose transport system ATP-binding protein
MTARGEGADAAAAGVALRLHGLSKTFPGQRALDDVDLEVAAGEVHALVGQNGSGKSTIVKILAGYHQPDIGAVAEVADVPFELGSAVAATAVGLRFVHQDLGLVESMTVSDNFRMNRKLSPLVPLRRRDDRAAARRALVALGYDIDPGATIGQLAESERTAVAVARALDGAGAGGTFPLLVLDEATASLPGPEVDRLFGALRRVAAGGTAILFISHYLDEVLTISDRVTVLRDGRRVTTERGARLTHERLAHLMLGRELVADAAAHTRVEVPPADSEPVLTIRAVGGADLAPLSLDVHPGEVVGIAGLTGSGRDELASLLAGRIPRTGDVFVAGRLIPAVDPRRAIDAGLCYVPADRARDAMFGLSSVRENLTIADLRPFWSRGRLDTKAENRHARHWVDELDVRPARPSAVMSELSGGNQQRVVMARWFRCSPRVLVLDEPTQGVDVGSKADIHRLVDLATAEGTATIVCSSDNDELARLCSRVVVLQRGVVIADLRGDEISSERIEELQLVPLAAADVVISEAPDLHVEQTDREGAVA